MTAADRDVRHAAILALDVVGSTQMMRALGHEATHARLTAMRAQTRAIVEANGGRIVDEAGDGVLAAFGALYAIENPALRGANAALDICSHLRKGTVNASDDDILSVRIGLAEGPIMVVRENGTCRVIGDAVVLAARLEAAAAPGEILISQGIVQQTGEALLSEPYPSQTFKGFDSPITPSKLLGLMPISERFSKRTISPFSGRVDELALARAALSDTARGRCILIEGEAGIGKSRFAHELLGGLDPARLVFVGRGVQGGLAADYSVIFDLMRDAIGAPATCPAHDVISALIEPQEKAAFARFRSDEPDELDPVGRAEANRAFLSAILTQLVTQADAIILLEDLHWIDGPSRAILRDLTSRPIDIIMTTRPDEAALRVTPSQAVMVSLGPLSADETGTILTGSFDKPLSDPLRTFILELVEGLPFAAVEIARSLQEDDRLTETDGVLYLSEGVDVILTGNLQQLVLARLDQQSGPVREALLAAAVIGRTFEERFLSDVLGQPVSLGEDLIGTGLIEQLDPGRWRFSHALIRESLSQSILASDRQRLHRQIFDALCAQPYAIGDAGRRAEHALMAGRTAQGAGLLVDAAYHRFTNFAIHEAVEDCERVADLLETDPNLLEPAQFRRMSGTWLRGLDHRGDHLALVATAERLLTRLEEDPYSTALTLARTLQANSLCRMRQYDRARDIATLALTDATSQGDDHGAAWARAALMRYYDETGQATADIIAMAEQIAPVARASQDTHLEMTCLYLLSSALRSAGRRKEALKAVEALKYGFEGPARDRASAYAAWASALIYAIEDNPLMAQQEISVALDRATPQTGDARMCRAIDLYVRVMLSDPLPPFAEIETLVAESRDMGDMNIAHSTAWVGAVLHLRTGHLARGWRAIIALQAEVVDAGNQNLVRQTLLLRAEVLLAIAGLSSSEGLPRPRRPGLSDLITWGRLRLIARKSAKDTYTACRELCLSKTGSQVAMCEIGLARIAAAEGRLQDARDRLKHAAMAASAEGLSNIKKKATNLSNLLAESRPSDRSKFDNR